MTEFDKMISGQMYQPSDPTLTQMRLRARKLTAAYNRTSPDSTGERDALLRDLLGQAGESITIDPTFHCDYGCNIRVGDNFYANVGCVILDCAEVQFGDNCFLAPQVGIYAATHPIDPVERNSGREFALPGTVGNNCWIGGHASLNPGVTLGNNVVVGAGAVVTKSFPDNVVIAGNPARILRQIPPQEGSPDLSQIPH